MTRNCLSYSLTVCPLLEEAALALVDRPLPPPITLTGDLSSLEPGTGLSAAREDKEGGRLDNHQRTNSGKGVRRGSPRRTLPQFRLPLRLPNGRIA